MKTPGRFGVDVANVRSVLLVAIILLAGTAVGALAGYRMHLTADLEDQQGPVTAVVIIEWPDADPFHQNVTVDGHNATALGFTEQSAEQGNFTLGLKDGMMGTYVHQIGEHRAEGNCGWLYSVGHEGGEPQDGDRAADLTRVFEGGTVHWRWGCIQG